MNLWPSENRNALRNEIKQKQFQNSNSKTKMFNLILDMQFLATAATLLPFTTPNS